MTKTVPTWTVGSLQAFRQSRGWPELPADMSAKVAAAIHDIQDHHDTHSPDSTSEPAMLFQPVKRNDL